MLLSTKGARTGEPRIVRVLGTPDGDGFIIVAANFGQRANPACYYNLRAHPPRLRSRRRRRKWVPRPRTVWSRARTRLPAGTLLEPRMATLPKVVRSTHHPGHAARRLLALGGWERLRQRASATAVRRSCSTPVILVAVSRPSQPHAHELAPCGQGSWRRSWSAAVRNAEAAAISRSSVMRTVGPDTETATASAPGSPTATHRTPISISPWSSA